MNVGLAEEEEVFQEFVAAADSADRGFSFSKVGNVKVNFIANNNKLIDDRKQLKVAQLTFDESNVRLSRIDGNHRLSAAAYLKNDIIIPFCLIIFSDEQSAKNNSRAIFHNINSQQIPLELEQNIKIIIESSNVFTNDILEKSQPFGLRYKFTRELLCGEGKIDFAYFPYIEKLVHDKKYSFFTDLFKYLLKEGLVNELTAVTDIKRELVNVESALKEADIVASSQNSAIVGA